MISTNVSRKTLNEFDKIVNEYKIKVLDDINDHFKLNIEKQEFRNMFLKTNNHIINRKKADVDYDKCYAIVYYKKYGYNQCKRSKCKGNFCNLHSQRRFYGDITKNTNSSN